MRSTIWVSTAGHAGCSAGNGSRPHSASYMLRDSRSEPVSASTHARSTSTSGIDGAAASASRYPSGRQAGHPGAPPDGRRGRNASTWRPRHLSHGRSRTRGGCARQTRRTARSAWPGSRAAGAGASAPAAGRTGGPAARSRWPLLDHVEPADRYAAWIRHSCPSSAASGCPSASARSATSSPSRIRSAVSAGWTSVISRACAASISATEPCSRRDVQRFAGDGLGLRDMTRIGLHGGQLGQHTRPQMVAGSRSASAWWHKRDSTSPAR